MRQLPFTKLLQALRKTSEVSNLQPLIGASVKDTPGFRVKIACSSRCMAVSAAVSSTRALSKMTLRDGQRNSLRKVCPSDNLLTWYLAQTGLVQNKGLRGEKLMTNPLIITQSITIGMDLRNAFLKRIYDLSQNKFMCIVRGVIVKLYERNFLAYASTNYMKYSSFATKLEYRIESIENTKVSFHRFCNYATY